MMEEIDKLRVLLPQWIEHNGEHAQEFRDWAERAGLTRDGLLAVARLLGEANIHLQEGLEQLGGPLEHQHGGRQAPSGPFLGVGGYLAAAGSAREAAKGLSAILGAAARGRNMVRPLWQLLLEDPSDLTCEECFAMIEYYAEMLARGKVDLLPSVIEHLKRCPSCKAQYRKALRSLVASQSETSTASSSDLTESHGSEAEEKGHLGDCGTGVVGCRTVETVEYPLNERGACLIIIATDDRDARREL
jgi:hypothetical protein